MRYVAYDGKEFNTAAECTQYEANMLNAKPQMWDFRGNLTDDIEQALLVHLANLSQTAWFINKSKALSVASDDIDEASIGWFYWEDWENRYVWMDEELINVIRKSAMTVATVITD